MTLDRTVAETSFLENILSEFRKEHDVQLLVEKQDEYEHEYWIKRLATQSALELLTAGRIGVGNMEALMQMGSENFRKALVETTIITNQVKDQVKYLDMIGDNELLENNGPKEIEFKEQ